MLNRTILTAATTLALLLPGSMVAHAAPLLSTFGGPNGHGTDHLPPNDDRSSDPIDITSAFPGGLNFFGTTHTQMYVNTNGNITFSGGVSTFTPNPFPVADRPMIAPYWGDVDIRGAAYPASNEVSWVLRPQQIVVTWHNVGYYSSNDDLVMDFQLVISNAESCGGGDFEVEFRFNICGWETGDASGGSGGFGGTQAQSGFDAGNDMDFVEIAGSREAGIAAHLCNNSNVAQPGIWQFSVRSGAVLCPGAGEPCDTGLPGVCAAGLTQCTGDSLSCTAANTPGTESCDGLDNDCDGSIDNGDLCSGLSVCVNGACVDPCFEGGCFEGQICNPEGFCVDTSCADVSCGPTERCVEGVCQAACSGVVCPYGQQCLGGNCVAACDLVACGDDYVCVDGMCLCPCPGLACAAGETCGGDGICIAAGCDLTICDDGFYCVEGECLDACAGVTCPLGQACMTGMCSPIPMGTDAGMSGRPDAGALADAGPGFDAGSTTSDSGAGTDGATSEPDAGSRVAGDPTGCSCKVGSQQEPSPFGLLLGLGMALMVFRRRR